MEMISITSGGKLIMLLLCLCGMPQGKETLRIDVIAEKGVIETFVAKPTADGFSIFEKDGVKKLKDIRRNGSGTSFLVPDGLAPGEDRGIELEKMFPSINFKEISTVSNVEGNAMTGGTFKLTRSGGTVYVTGPPGVLFSIHQ